MPPMPVIPFHATTAADPKGETTVSVVFGVATQALGGGGFGLALRMEHQQTDRTSLGVEVTGGKFEADDENLWLFAVRGYGKGTPREHDWTAVTYGAGLSVLTTGMLSLQIHGGGAIAYPNDVLVPYLTTGLAASVPLIYGRPFGHLRDAERHGWARKRRGPLLAGAIPFAVKDASEGPPKPLRSEIYFYGGLGFGLSVGDSGNIVSLDFSLAAALREDAGYVALSLGDTQH